MSDESYTIPAALPSFDRAVADLKQGVDTATKAQADVTAKASEAGRELLSFAQANIEAMAQASQLLVAGSQGIVRDMMASSQAAVKETMAGVRAMVAASSTKERIELQASLTRTAASWMVTESSRFAQAGLDLAERTTAPLTARAVAAAELMAPKQ